MLHRIRREPLLLAIAVVVVVLGFDIDQVTETVNRLLELIAVLGAAGAARTKATPTADPRAADGTPLVPASHG